MDLRRVLEFAQSIAGATLNEVALTAAEQYVGSRADDRKRRKAIADFVDNILSTADYRALSLQVREAFRWAAEIHEQGMHRAIDTQAVSVPLSFSAIPRRFRGQDGVDSSLDERGLIQSSDSYLILGEPGSGKTTTLKRLTLTLLDEPPPSDSVPILALPIVLICRQIDWSTTDLPSEILRRLGLDITALPIGLIKSPSRMIALAADILDRSDCLLVLDGLDEITEVDARAAIIASLASLRRMVTVARLICSCRSGDAPHLDGYTVAELMPLSRAQVSEIVRLRLDSADEFLAAVEVAGIDEGLLNRPLFLTQLLTVYESTGNMPDRPVDLYRQLVRLLIREWDEQRIVTRKSRYQDFDRETKQEFLSEIAYYLTIEGKATFREADLMAIYRSIHERFRLPEREAVKVVREIESHVGIIAEIPAGFQFSHYTMQEYLCADNIARRPIDEEVIGYLRKFPAVIAVAVALSSNPTRWLTECVERSRDFTPQGLSATFVSRLGLEHPRFTTDEKLGDAILRLMRQADPADAQSWRHLSQLPAVRASVALSLTKFQSDRVDDRVTLSRRRQNEQPGRIRPAFMRVPVEIFEMVVDRTADHGDARA